jgi:hypothetical protein
MSDMSQRYELAQVNIGRLLASVDDPLIAGFMAALDPINALADVAPGFVWRLQTEDGNATAVQAFAWDQDRSAGVIMNMSVWTDVESLGAFVYSADHAAIMRGRRQWFERMAEAYTCCWWVPAGQRPTTAEAEDKIRLIRVLGPTPDAFTLRSGFPPPSEPAPAQALPDRDDWTCTA